MATTTITTTIMAITMMVLHRHLIFIPVLHRHHIFILALHHQIFIPALHRHHIFIPVLHHHLFIMALITIITHVLRSTHIAWRTSYGGNVPIDAIRVGGTCNGEPLYVGRVFHCGALSVGKVHPSHGCLYLPFDGRELKFTEYEILVLC